ncbi:DUF4331 family protein [Algivirga pacifica]|uniref:Uncharacterized protein n=1 Tax=Algivirga pacifica TaxID=1162670 RepID=A0ABP9CYK2_9BACT
MKQPILTQLLKNLSLISLLFLTTSHRLSTYTPSISVENHPLSKVTDFYVFESPSTSSNMVFACNVGGMLGPEETKNSGFQEAFMYEFNIDTDRDGKEELLIQVIFRDGEAIVYGPQQVDGDQEILIAQAERTAFKITPWGEDPVIGYNKKLGLKAFVGLRDNTSFMDYYQMLEIFQQAKEGGQKVIKQFREAAGDTFAGTNTRSIVLELPKNSLGNTDVNTFYTWVEVKVRR